VSIVEVWGRVAYFGALRGRERHDNSGRRAVVRFGAGPGSDGGRVRATGDRVVETDIEGHTLMTKGKTGAAWVILAAGALVLCGLSSSALGGEGHGVGAPKADGSAAEHGSHAVEASAEGADHAASGHGEGGHTMPHLVWVTPFVVLLLCIAILPLVHKTEPWWEKNSSKLLVAVVLGVITVGYYLWRGEGFHDAAPGLPTVGLVLSHAILADYVPFIVLLFSLYVISGGINLSGDLRAHPLTNTAFIGLGALLASFIGTTGSAMLLIRPLLQTNSERRYVKHTVIVFIFLACNIGGCLLPIGDPPLFLGYLRGVPFLWTFHLWKEWLFLNALILLVYFLWDTRMYRKEAEKDLRRDARELEPIRIRGSANILLLLGVVLAVGTLVPGQRLPGLGWMVPDIWHGVGLRELAQLAMAGISMWLTPKAIRQANDFNFTAIGEVACLFIGIFVCMQVPVEILHGVGPMLPEYNLTSPRFFFWATGILSSFLDNAPTYVVYFETARSLEWSNPDEMLTLTTGGQIAVPLLIAISLGAVFMGANSYIGNGPNFMVKSIAEQSGVKMPSFFGYMAYSVAILVPFFVIVMFLFM